MKRRRRAHRTVLNLLATAAALLLIAAIAAEYWIGPAIVRSRLEEACSQFWSGPVRIAAVKFNLFGPIRVRGLELLDDRGALHVSIGALSLVRRNNSPLETVITDVIADDVDLRVRRVAGRFTSPIRIPQRGRLLDRHVDLQSMRIRSVSVQFHEDGERSGGLDLREALLSREDSGSYSLQINARTVLSKLKTAIVRAEVPGNTTGRQFSAAVLGGTLNGSCRFTREPKAAQVSYHVLLQTDGVNLGMFSDILGDQWTLGTGVLNGRFEFRGCGGDLDDLRGSGQLTLSDVDARRDPLTGPVLEFLGGSLEAGRTTSRVRAEFTLDSAVVTLDEAELTDALRIMRVDEGGTINLTTRELDLYLTTLQLRGLSKLVTRIPVVHLATNLSNKLTRIHVTGTWDEVIFRNEPVEDVSSATLEFLQETLAAAVPLPGVVPGYLGELLQSLKKTATLSPSTTSAPQR